MGHQDEDGLYYLPVRPPPLPRRRASAHAGHGAAARVKSLTLHALTASIRRVKCDEAKPMCNRCMTSGRMCDGYKNPPQKPSKQSASTESDGVPEPRMNGNDSAQSVYLTSSRSRYPGKLSHCEYSAHLVPPDWDLMEAFHYCWFPHPLTWAVMPIPGANMIRTCGRLSNHFTQPHGKSVGRHRRCFHADSREPWLQDELHHIHL